jgi:K(+)-stimulated pyrophosphate-energized sodium pump
VVFLFSGLAINAVSRAAGAVVFEVRRQFREIPGIMEGTGKPEYGRVVDICTRDSLRELATPGLLAVMARSASTRRRPLGCYLAGAIAAGTLMAVFWRTPVPGTMRKLIELATAAAGNQARATVIGIYGRRPVQDTADPVAHCSR